MKKNYKIFYNKIRNVIKLSFVIFLFKKHGLVMCLQIPLQAQIGIPVRKYRIFMCMLPREERTYPLQVVVTATARVLDFIGLICYKYASEHPDHNLKSVTSYLTSLAHTCLIHEVSAGRYFQGGHFSLWTIHH